MEWDPNAVVYVDRKKMYEYEARISIGAPAVGYAHEGFDTLKPMPSENGSSYLVVREGGCREFSSHAELREHYNNVGNRDPLFGHFDRLEHTIGCSKALKKLPIEKKEFVRYFRELVEENAALYEESLGYHPPFYARAMVWQDKKQETQRDKIGVANNAPARWAILITPYTPYIETKKDGSEENPLGAMLVDSPRLIPPECMDRRAKLAPRYGLMANGTHTAREFVYHEAILKDMKGNVGEGGGENLVCYRKGIFIIPLSDSVLPGFTQDFFVLSAKLAGYPVEEAVLKPDDLRGMEAMWFTGTAAGLELIWRLGNEQGKQIWTPRFSADEYKNGKAPTAILEVTSDFNDYMLGKKKLPEEYRPVISEISMN